MGSGKLARRVAAALVMSAGTAAAGDSDVVPASSPATPSDVLFSKPLPTSTPSSVGLDLSLPLAAPSAPGGPAESAAPPRINPLVPGDPPVAPLPPPLPASPALISDSAGWPLNPGPWQPGLSWARGEYLFWHLTGGHLPALSTTGPVDEPIAIPGFPGRAVVFGETNPLDQPRSGARLTVGTWLDQTRDIGVEASGFWVAQQRTTYVDGSLDGSRVLAGTPFVDPTTGLASAVLISFPGITSGAINVAYTGRSIWGAEALLRPLLSAGPGWRLDGLVGYRYRGFSESLSIQETLVPLAPFFVPGTMIVSNDTIRVDNQFQGGVIGFDCEKDCGGWLINLRPSIGIGRMFTTVDRTGATLIRVPGTPDLVFPGGLYNLSSNLGQVHANDCTVIPEVDVRISKTIWECVRLSIGYSAIYFPGVARAGEQIDPFVNPNLLPPVIPGGPPRPAPILEQSSAWLHGFTFGLEVRY